MKARETTFKELIEGQKQFQVPLFQRTYTWTDTDLQQFWDDVLDQADELADGQPGPTHFLGSIVLAPSPLMQASDVRRWLIVDGQQRLTTWTLAMCALRDHLAETDQDEFSRINELYLINRWKRGPGPDRYRLLPTQGDQTAFFACIDDTPTKGGGDNIGGAYNYFRRVIVKADDPNDPHDLERVESVLCARLEIVEVTADAADNVHRIFESLNNTGVGLSQADLVRNYLFMNLPERGPEIYEAHWLPMQRALGEDLELLIYLDLVLHGNERARQADLYSAEQRRLEPIAKDENALAVEVARLATRARHLERILRPAGEPDSELRAALGRLNTWGAQTTYPLVMHLLDLREQGDATTEELNQALVYVESFLVRRMLCGVYSGNLNRIFNAIIKQLPRDLPIAEAVRVGLSQPGNRWPTDQDVGESVRAKPFYLNGRHAQRTMVLQRLEESLGSKERIDFTGSKLQIEHILPRTLTDQWRDLLTKDAAEQGMSGPELHRRVVHTLGNLTLTGYNPELSNATFERKQRLLRDSGLGLNRLIAAASRWGYAEIIQRAHDLAELAVSIWPGPVPTPAGGVVGSDWSLLHQALAVLPAGSWTTYGDVAELIGSHPVPVGQHLAGVRVPNQHRVLTRDGKVSPQFHWHDPHDTRDPYEVLRSEGLRFDATGNADPNQRLGAEDLAQLLGLGEDWTQPPRDGEDNDSAVRSQRRESFFRQLRDRQPPETAIAVERLLEHWRRLGGYLTFGRGQETSCFLMLRSAQRRRRNDWWPLVVYPLSGTCSVYFGPLSKRPPFDDERLRDHFRRLCNRAPGVDLPTTKLALYPSFALAVLTNNTAPEQLLDALQWFVQTAEDPLSAAILEA
jgi:alkylated DNA nucleotide flippase Atl1